MDDPLGQLRLHFAGLRLREEGPHGRVYTGHDTAGGEVTVAVLTGASATDPGTRNAFADVVWRHSVGSQPGRATVQVADLHAPQPWAATRAASGEPGAEQLLAGLAGVPVPPGPPAAPGLAAAPVPPAAPGFAAAPVPPAAPGFAAAPVPPAGGYPPPPAPRSGRAGAWLVGIVGGALAVVLVAVVAGLAVRTLRTADQAAPPATRPAGATVAPSPSPAPAPSTSPEPADGGGDGGDGRPVLREVELVSVVGPTFGDSDDTYTMAFAGWPVAFRTPGSWGCLRGGIDSIPDADVWTCIDEDDPGNGQRANFLLWECATSCTETEQADMIDRWLDEPDKAVERRSSPTYYVETEAGDFYSVDLGHFFGEDRDGPLRWLVGVYVESPFDTRADVQKILNDVVSQAGGAGG